ncbi:hypothetical protein BKA65DRAFT_490295 [Rhexocercosporidium sp. MPI-PUGE-AT-0058]|nr:hypothetical protein BKA65DRAFT_490295 [Rhexocercosporidium sp. MPI-PUGE-AT-0058]
MSTDRRWDQRGFVIEESATSNGGKRTIFVETMSPGTTVPPHFHTRFSETLDLVKGSMKVYKTDQPDLEKLEASAQTLQIGNPKIVEPLMYHRYTVEDEVTALRVTLTPGDLGFEQILKIMIGLADDKELEKYGDDVILMGVFYELADTHLIGSTKKMIEDLHATRGSEIRALKTELLDRYDTEEALRKLLSPTPKTL